MSQEPVWAEWALQSEIAISTALGGKATRHEHFIHVHNPAVPWGGDFNRALGAVLNSIEKLDLVLDNLAQLHRELTLDPPDRIDALPPPLDETAWQRSLRRRGYVAYTATFLVAPALSEARLPSLSLVCPSEDQYMTWYHAHEVKQAYYEDQWFRTILPLRLRFIQVFRPYWLLSNQEPVAWTHCAHLGAYSRLFDVEVDQPRRGRGLGRALLDAIRSESTTRGAGYVLVDATDETRGFYEKAGFVACTANSVIRRAPSASD